MQVVFEAMGDREKNVETSAEWVLKSLHGEAIADIGDLYDQAVRALSLFTIGRLYGALGSFEARNSLVSLLETSVMKRSLSMRSYAYKKRIDSNSVTG
jgi:hypothetical protein